MTEVKPYKVIPIRLKGTNKTETIDHTGKEWGRKNVKSGNCLDPFRGCVGYANPHCPMCPWDCYSEEAVRRFKKDFGRPVAMELKEHLLRRDLVNLKALGIDWVRIGVDGEPLSDGGELTADVVRIVAEEDLIPIVVTRLWKPVDPQFLRDMVDHGAVFNITVSAADEPYALLQRRLNTLATLMKMQAKVSLRVVTFAFQSNDERWIAQQRLMDMGLTLEQPARIMRRTPNTKRVVAAWDWVDRTQYKPYHSYITGKVNKRWWTAGQLYDGFACVKDCTSCENKCMAALHYPDKFPIQRDLIMERRTAW